MGSLVNLSPNEIGSTFIITVVNGIEYLKEFRNCIINQALIHDEPRHDLQGCQRVGRQHADGLSQQGYEGTRGENSRKM
uniref:Uncharacterized protein n=1 Tax=Steinernema glaseri TaxID=37863 RepID=A0A1I7Y7U1_9BILA